MVHLSLIPRLIPHRGKEPGYETKWGVVFFNVLNFSLVSLFHLVLLLALSLAQLVDTAGENSLRKHSLMEER